MLNFLIILLIRLIDIPLLENNPFIFSWIKRRFLLEAPIYDPEKWDQIEREQMIDEIAYVHEVGLYEYNLFIKLFNHLKGKFIHGDFFLAIIVLLTVIYNRRENIIFLISAIMLPISFYYLCVLMDYYEAIEELLKHIKYILSLHS